MDIPKIKQFNLSAEFCSLDDICLGFTFWTFLEVSTKPNYKTQFGGWKLTLGFLLFKIELYYHA